MEEENNNEIQEEQTIEKEELQETSIVARAERANKELDEKIKYYEGLKQEVDEAKATLLLSGNSEAGNVQPEEKPEELSAKDYAMQVLEGKHNEE